MTFPSTPQLAPDWMPRQLRRRIDRQLRKLIDRGVCSLCGGELEHNTRMFGGLDRRDDVALVGECCADRMAEIFIMGLASSRRYDFLLPRETSSTIKPVPTEQLASALAAYQQVIAATDKQLEGIEQRGGVARSPGVNLLDHPWKDDDRDWV